MTHRQAAFPFGGVIVALIAGAVTGSVVGSLPVMACVAFIGVSVALSMSKLEPATRTIEYERVDMGKYHHQATVTDYPGSIGRLFGEQSSERVFVSERLLATCENHDWYEVPSFEELHCISDLAYAIARTVRQQQFTESGGAPTQEGE